MPGAPISVGFPLAKAIFRARLRSNLVAWLFNCGFQVYLNADSEAANSKGIGRNEAQKAQEILTANDAKYANQEKGILNHTGQWPSRHAKWL